MDQQQLEQFQRKDVRILFVAVAIALVSIVVTWVYFDDAFPEASIRFEVDKEASETIGQQFLETLGFTISPYKHASIFDYDNQAKIYLERTQGLEETNDLLSGSIRIWRWNHRWYQSKEKEEFQVAVSPRGAIIRYDHVLPEDAGDAHLSEREARALAEETMTSTLSRSLTNLTFLEHASEKLPNRTDHTFTWRRTDLISGDSNADYRYEVTIKGDEFGGYREYLKVPEAWSREYQQLRSANNTTGQVASFFLLLTVLVMLVVLIQKSRLGDIKWKTGLKFGVVAFVLMLASQLNSLPITLYNYSTTDAYGDFLTQEILLSLLQALLAGGGIFFLTAAAEPLYRERYGDKLSVSKAFTLRGIKTKKFFIAIVVGLVLTCFFMAYQTVFYLISANLGAWSPADIPYSELLNTAIPWIFVLLMGFFPAVSEEFISRMFSIPFLEKYLKVRWLAVLIPALIWGFGHAAYPNQPFYIRGLEVGVAGVIIGYVMLRFGIVAALIWHYTVDALYTAFLLFRSGDPYFIASGAISTGIFLIPLVIAGIFYLRNGGFLPSQSLTNQDEGSAPPRPPSEPKQFEIRYNKLSYRKIGIGIVAGLILFSGIFLSSKSPTDFVNVKISKQEIIEDGHQWLKSRTDSAEAFRRAVTMSSGNRAQVLKYLLENTTVDSAQMVLEDLLYPEYWRIRYFHPLEKEEYRLHYHPDTGELLAFQHIVSESTPGDSLTELEARDRAFAWLVSNDVDTSMYTIRSVEQNARPNRLDYEITFEGRDSFWANIGQGKALLRMSVTGGEVGKFIRDYKLPEEWLRTRTAQTLGRTFHNIGRIVVLILFGISGIVLLIVKLRNTDSFQWRPTIVIGIIVALLVVLTQLNRWSVLVSEYTTTIPWSQFQIGLVISLILAGIVYGGIILLGTALARLYYPGSLLAWKAPERYVFARDSLFTVLIALLGFVGLTEIQSWIKLQFPALALFSTDTIPTFLSSTIPAFGAIGSAFTQGLLYAVGLGLFTIIWNKYFNHGLLRFLLVVLVFLALVPPRMLTWSEWGLQALLTLLPLLWSGAIWWYYMRDNYLSYLMIPLYLLGLRFGYELYMQNGSAYIIHGIVVFAIFSILWFWTLADALRHRDENG
ncbi:MAG: CPBP family intramembrane metalloprotease [Candidatus Marinimicrobia bacterium]|nr:CPBP family intramembrane metalloprotease [Candidatus Neomarinimicrobiota bacterium]MCF7828511.1 CPBP family intramembrane metalloprotease [Candidatus Neomarinimicrobiota bacterium]MCF7882066.1 CPBP family intramembrane metalloprotease [Candidatus Neomarinimicrobiota bacterium]